MHDENSKGAQCPLLSAEGRCRVIAVNTGRNDWPLVESAFDMTKLRAFIGKLKGHYRLLSASFVICLVAVTLVYLIASRTYTAEALLGPPAPSPTGTLLTSGGALASGLTTRMLGSGVSGGSDRFRDFQQLLPSTRLSKVLIERDHILKMIFYKRWDFGENRWKRPGLFGTLRNGLKRTLNLPVTDQPTLDDLTQFFADHLEVQKVNASDGLLGGQSAYLRISLTYGDPGGAERLLNLILSETDELIREHERHDVKSRITFLRRELKRESLAADERTALISILSDQEQLHSMIEADQRYASTLLIPPYASPKPSFPPSPGSLFVLAVVASTSAWAGVLFLSLYSERVNRLIAFVERRIFMESQR